MLRERAQQPLVVICTCRDIPSLSRDKDDGLETGSQQGVSTCIMRARETAPRGRQEARHCRCRAGTISPTKFNARHIEVVLECASSIVQALKQISRHRQITASVHVGVCSAGRSCLSPLSTTAHSTTDCICLLHTPGSKDMSVSSTAPIPAAIDCCRRSSTATASCD